MWHTLLKVDFDYLICSTLCFHEFPPKYYVHYLCSLAKARKENPQLCNENFVFVRIFNHNIDKDFFFYGMM